MQIADINYFKRKNPNQTMETKLKLMLKKRNILKNLSESAERNKSNQISPSWPICLANCVSDINILY